MRKLSVLIALVLLSAPASQAKTLDEVLAGNGVVATRGDSAASGSAAKAWWDGGTKVEFPDQGFSAKITTSIQTRYEYTNNDSGADTSSFDIHKARLAISGSALNKEFDYMLKVDFVDGSAADGSATPVLSDAYLTWHVADPIWLRMGQWKTGVSRQFNANDETLMFADRSFASNSFSLGRNIGAAVGGSWDAFAWQVAMFNGNDTGEGQNLSGTDENHSAVVNLRWDAMGHMDAAVEGDVDGTQDAALNVGFAMAYDDSKSSAANSLVTGRGSVYNLDVNFKYQGWSANAEGFYRDADADSAGDPWAGYVQVGYMICPHQCEVALRYGHLDYDSASDDNEEYAASFNYYFWKHNLKAQLGVAHNDAGDNNETTRYLLQLSSWF